MTLTAERMTLNLDAMTDPRADARIEDRRAVRVFEPYAGKFVAGLTLNVSAKGVCLLMPADTELRSGRFVTLHGGPTVGPTLGDERCRATTARVVWVAFNPDDAATVRVGLQVYAAVAAAAA